MSDKEKAKQFFDGVIYNAAKMTGDTTAIMPIIQRLCNELGITESLDEIVENNKRLQEKELENEREKAAASIAALAAGYDKADQSARQNIIDSLQRECNTLNKTAASGKRNRYSSWADFVNKCKSYDPSKDFRPSMLAGLRFPDGTLSYIGARPGGGKSTMLINIAREALAAGRKVFLVNLEMVDRAVNTNFILSLMYGSADNEQRKELDGITEPNRKYYSLFKNESDTRETFDNLRKTAMEKMPSLLESNLFIYDGAGESLETIISEIERKLTAGDVVLIDYVQRLSPPKNTNDQQYIKIKLISNALLTLALTKKLVIISGAQFGRQSKENRDKCKEATMDDFREGGDIEQDAHNAVAIEKITDNEENDTGRYIHVLKAREGGATYKRQKLDCNFNYLFIGGIEGEYNHNGQAIDPVDNKESRKTGEKSSDNKLWKPRENA